jgi:hypothetical protein
VAVLERIVPRDLGARLEASARVVEEGLVDLAVVPEGGEIAVNGHVRTVEVPFPGATELDARDGHAGPPGMGAVSPGSFRGTLRFARFTLRELLQMPESLLLIPGENERGDEEDDREDRLASTGESKDNQPHRQHHLQADANP